MSVYKRKYRDKHGKQRRGRSFTAEFVYHGKLHREGGFPDRESALSWLNTESLRLRRGGKGYVKPLLSEPISPLIERFTTHLATHGRDSEYCIIAGQRLRRLCNECAWLTLGDIDAASAETWKSQPSYWRGRPKQPVSNKSKNQIIQIAKQFCAWLVKPVAKLAVNPLVDVEPLTHRDNTEYRRAGTVDELNKLLATCPEDIRTTMKFYNKNSAPQTLSDSMEKLPTIAGRKGARMNEYTQMRTVFVAGGVMHGGPSPVILRDRGEEWFLEWHGCCGPTLLHRVTHEVREMQPPAKSRFWRVAQWWYDQGGKVVDGVGVWTEPPIVEERYRHLGGRQYIADSKGPIVQYLYKGYERWQWRPDAASLVAKGKAVLP